MESKKILIVEDDKMLSTLFQMFVKQLGYNLIGFVQTGESAIEKCKEELPDVVLMDIHIKGELNGIETARKLYEFFDIPVIYVSSDDEDITVQNAIHVNTYGFLVKPIHKTTLGILVESAYYKHKYDKELQVQDRRKRAQIDVSKNPILIVVGGKIIYANYHGLELFEVEQIENLLDQDILSFVENDSIEEIKDKIKVALSDNVPIEYFETTVQTSTGNHVSIGVEGDVVEFEGKKGVKLEVKKMAEVV